MYTPIYDIVGSIFHKSRKKSISLLDIQPNESVLLIGAGTGLDLPFISSKCKITATDLTPSMVSKMKVQCNTLKLKADVLQMDGMQLIFADNSFDKIILHLILAVIPDPVKCIQEAERVLKKGGLIVVFDKFLREGKTPGFVRRMFNGLTNFLFSNINRDIYTIVSKTSLQIANDIPVDFGGNFRIIVLKKV